MYLYFPRHFLLFSSWLIMWSNTKACCAQIFSRRYSSLSLAVIFVDILSVTQIRGSQLDFTRDPVQSVWTWDRLYSACSTSPAQVTTTTLSNSFTFKYHSEKVLMASIERERGDDTVVHSPSHKCSCLWPFTLSRHCQWMCCPCRMALRPTIHILRALVLRKTDTHDLTFA